jgi:hypothetical protein
VLYELPSALADESNHNTSSALAEYKNSSIIRIAFALRIDFFFYKFDLINPSAKAEPSNSYFINFNSFYADNLIVTVNCGFPTS